MRLPKNKVFRPVVARYVLHHTEFCVSKARFCFFSVNLTWYLDSVNQT